MHHLYGQSWNIASWKHTEVGTRVWQDQSSSVIWSYTRQTVRCGQAASYLRRMWLSALGALAHSTLGSHDSKVFFNALFLDWPSKSYIITNNTALQHQHFLRRRILFESKSECLGRSPWPRLCEGWRLTGGLPVNLAGRPPPCLGWPRWPAGWARQGLTGGPARGAKSDLLPPPLACSPMALRSSCRAEEPAEEPAAETARARPPHPQRGSSCRLPAL